MFALTKERWTGISHNLVTHVTHLPLPDHSHIPNIMGYIQHDDIGTKLVNTTVTSKLTCTSMLLEGLFNFLNWLLWCVSRHAKPAVSSEHSTTCLTLSDYFNTTSSWTKQKGKKVLYTQVKYIIHVFIQIENYHGDKFHFEPNESNTQFASVQEHETSWQNWCKRS